MTEPLDLDADQALCDAAIAVCPGTWLAEQFPTDGGGVFWDATYGPDDPAERYSVADSCTEAVARWLVMARYRLPRYIARVRELEAIIAKHDLCHDLHGKVGRAEFEEGCRRETIKEFGSCGWAQRIAELEAKNARLQEALRPFVAIFGKHFERFINTRCRVPCQERGERVVLFSH